MIFTCEFLAHNGDGWMKILNLALTYFTGQRDKLGNGPNWTTGLNKFRLISKAYLSPFLHTNSASISIRHEMDILSACKLITFYVVDV